MGNYIAQLFHEYAILFFNSRYPIGHFIRALGPIGDKATENEVLLLEHDIPHSSFSEAVLDCLPTLPWDITPQGNNFQISKNLKKRDPCSARIPALLPPR
jgi:exosome complex exonuclease DIS3/RRP44